MTGESGTITRRRRPRYTEKERAPGSKDEESFPAPVFASEANQSQGLDLF